ncbi:MAG TPA: hypothetical protein VF857_07280 [Spirochaetota bacterium]
MAKKHIDNKTKEYIDSNGEKWVQTSPDDLFSIKELNDVFEAVERDRNSNEIVLARIDFRTVNREFYETVQELESRLKKKEELIKRLMSESQRVIKRKNDMMFDMIEYIKQLQLLVARKSISPDLLKGISLEKAFRPGGEEETEEKAVYEEVKEVTLGENGEEPGA